MLVCVFGQWSSLVNQLLSLDSFIIKPLLHHQELALIVFRKNFILLHRVICMDRVLTFIDSFFGRHLLSLSKEHWATNIWSLTMLWVLHPRFLSWSSAGSQEIKLSILITVKFHHLILIYLDVVIDLSCVQDGVLEAVFSETIVRLISWVNKRFLLFVGFDASVFIW